MSSVKETHNITRAYYHGMVADREMMVAYLIDEGVLVLGADTDKTISLYIQINDFFVPAADSEELPYDDVHILFEKYRINEWAGVVEYVANKRKVEPIHWRLTDTTRFLQTPSIVPSVLMDEQTAKETNWTNYYPF